MEEWISVEDSLPKSKPGELLKRVLVYTEYGITEGWYDAELGYWFALLWFMTSEYKNWNIDFERGDVPKLGIKVKVKAWMEYPEQPKE